MIHHSFQSDDYVWYLILRGKQKEKMYIKHNRKQSSSPFQWSGQQKFSVLAFLQKLKNFEEKLFQVTKSGEFSVPPQLTKLTMFGLNNFENTSVIVEENGGNVESDC